MEVSHTKQNGKTANRKACQNLTRKNQRLRRKVSFQKERLEIAAEELRQAEREIAQLEMRVESLRQQLEQVEEAQCSPVPAPFTDPNIFGHRFAASMVALCANLANAMPVRTVPKALEIVLDALDIATLIPNRETIMRWLKRLGVDKLKQNQTLDRWKDHKDIVWIVDHSNQIGTQKALLILAIPASQLPAAGETLSLDALEVLLIEPRDSWTRDNMRGAYHKLAQQVGYPRFVLCDGAVELRETVDVLCDNDHDVIVLRDFKHYAANRLESTIGKLERYQTFTAEVGRTRCRIQQTELAHLTPPGFKTKSRFMNIDPVISWAQMVLNILSAPESDAASVNDIDKLEERLGWLKDYREDIAAWHRCCESISWSLTWINTHCLTRESGKELQRHLDQLRKSRCELSDLLTTQLVAHVESSAAKLADGERSWLSSEALESVFGLFKRREGQQSRSGFTGLIATLPTLLCTWTANGVRAALQRTSTEEAGQWVTDNIGDTLWAKRTKAFKHFGTRKCRFIGTH